MELNKYQQQASTTAMYAEEYKILYPTLGLVGEAGEVAEKIKKMLRDEKGHLSSKRKEELVKELGDVLWYLAILAKDLGVDLNSIAQTNLDKLSSRKERGKITGDGDNR